MEFNLLPLVAFLGRQLFNSPIDYRDTNLHYITNATSIFKCKAVSEPKVYRLILNSNSHESSDNGKIPPKIILSTVKVSKVFGRALYLNIYAIISFQTVCCDIIQWAICIID